MAKTNNDITQIEEELKVDKNTLLGKWRAKAYDQKADKGWLQRFWNQYFVAEKGIYQKLLAEPDTEVKGTVSGLAEKYGVSVETMVGTRTWLMPRRTGCISFRSGMQSSRKRSRRPCTWNRGNRERSLNRRRSAAMSRAPAEAGKNINSAAEDKVPAHISRE